MARESILLEAHGLVTGDRQAAYGSATENFTRTAILCQQLGVPLDARQFGLVMVCNKLARHVHQPKRDNLVDACGYLELLSQIEESA